MEFNTNVMMRNCAKCHTQPSLRHRKEDRLFMHCDTCDAESKAWWTVDAAIGDWNDLMRHASGAAEHERTPEP